jgi:RNA recognition motif-containing protein
MSDAQAATVTENGVSPAAQENKIEEAPGFKVFAGNLAYTTTDDGLRAFFAPVESDILSAQVILRGTRSAGYGFVALSTAEAAQKAVELLDKKELEGRTVIVEIAKPSDQKDKERRERRSSKRRPGRRGAKAVPGEVTDAEANGEPARVDDTAAAASGTDEAAKPKKRKRRFPRKPRSRAAAPAAGETADAAPAASAEASGAEAPAEAAPRKPRKSKPRTPRAPRPPRPEGEAPVGEPSKTVLFVANLGFNIDDEGLKKLFTDADIAVTSARVVRRRYGHPRKSKGYGFVDVGNEEEQKKAIAALEGKDVDGRPIAVKVAVNSGNSNNPDDAPDAVTDVAAAPVVDTSAATA